MSESRKNHLTIDGGQVKEDEHIASYKPIPESDTAFEIEYTKGSSECTQLNQTDIMDADVLDDGDDHWDRSSINILLNQYLQNIDKFRDPKVRKKNVWTIISNTVGNGPDSCDKKFRNLKLTYMRLLKKKIKNKAFTVKWPYFDVFEEIFSVNGEYQPDIQKKIEDNTSETIAKTLLSMNSQINFEPERSELGESSSGHIEENQRKQTKKRYNDFRKMTLEMKERQKCVEEKLDRLINIVEESNSIQKERNRLFEQFLEKLNNT